MATFASPTSQLERGKACLRCRRRKMRCDGKRPTCGQCTRSNLVDCEYTDEGPTASQILEQNVALLEARIRELEGDSGVVMLHDPHASASARGSGSSGQVAPTTVPRNQRIMQAFVTYGPDFGFFLHLPRFLEKLRASIPITSQSTIPIALIHAVFLVGVMFSGDDDLKKEEAQILARAQQALSTDLDPARTLYMLQAEVLLSQYLFHKNSRVAGGYHAAAAVSIAVGCRLHKIRSEEWSVAAFAIPSIPDVQLFPPVDDIEEGERIRAFWIVYALDRCWTVATHSPSVLARQGTASTRVDTPWPLDMSGYEQHFLMPQGNTSARTVEQFVNGLSTELPNQSLLTLRAKASIVFEKSAQLVDKWNPNSAEFQAEFMALDARIDQLKSVLPAVESVSATEPDRLHQLRDLLVIHSLCYGATLQLHVRFGQLWDIDNSKAFAAATGAASVAQAVNAGSLVYVDAVMGILWAMVGQALVTALVTLKQNVNFNLSPNVAVSPGEIIVTSSLNSILNAMDALREHCPLIGEEASKLHFMVLQNAAGVIH